MGLLRQAGVWLGLVEDEYDHGLVEGDFAGEAEYLAARQRAMVRPRRGERDHSARDYPARDRRATGPTPRSRPGRPPQPERPDPLGRDPRAGAAREGRLREPAGREVFSDYEEPEPDPVTVPPRRSDRGQARPAPGSVRPLMRTLGPMATPTQENLALAPQVQLERAVVSDDTALRWQHITTLHPTTYSDARTIGERFRDSVPVIMDLTDMAEADAKRLVDFAAGLVFALRGSMDRVTNRVFLLSPRDHQVSAEDRARIAQDVFQDRD